MAHSQPMAHSQATGSRSQTPAHERTHSDMNINQHAAHSHHLSHYEHLTGVQTIGNFSMSDIELANKKLYASNAAPSSAAIDYGNWKLSQLRKQEMLAPSDYSAAYQHSVNQNEKHKQDMMMSSNYNKNLQQQYNMYNITRGNPQRTQDLQQSLPAELRIPNPRGHLKNDHMTTAGPNNEDPANKHIDSMAKNHKAEKLLQNHPLVTSNPYKTAYSSQALQLDSLRNLQNIPQMLERYSNDERFLSSFASSSALYDKQFQMAQMFNKSMASEVPASSASTSIYSQPSVGLSKDNLGYKISHGATPQPDPKPKQKRKKRTSESKSAQITSNQQSYHTPTGSADLLSSVKSGMMPTSSFNFGTSTNMATNMALSSGMYGDNPGFSANQLMAANYMVAAAARQQRSNAEASAADKLGKPAHQAAREAFPFMGHGHGHGQVRPGYGFVGSGVGVEPGSPLYQQYLQRQEELLRQTGAQIMGLYPPPYPPSLGVSQPYDTINMNRHSWL